MPDLQKDMQKMPQNQPFCQHTEGVSEINARESGDSSYCYDIMLKTSAVTSDQTQTIVANNTTAEANIIPKNLLPTLHHLLYSHTENSSVAEKRHAECQKQQQKYYNQLKEKNSDH